MIAIPLFVAERIVNRSTREAARALLTAGVIAPQERVEVTAVHRRVRDLQLSLAAEVVMIGLAFTLSFLTIRPEWRS